MRFNSLHDLPVIIRILLLTAGYFFLAEISLTFGINYGNVSPLWLPAGLAAAAILRWGYAVLPGIWAGTTLAVLDTNISSVSALLLGCSTCFEAMVLYFLCQLFLQGSFSFTSSKKAFSFLGISALSGSAGACIGVGILHFQGYVPLETAPLNLFTWWLGDLSGMLLLTPLLLSWSFDLSRTSWNQWAEYALYYGILLPVSYLLFHGTTPYLFLIFVIYAVFRFPFVHVLLTMLSGDLIAIGMARFEHGAFTNSTLTGDLLSIQLFIIVTSVTGLFLYSVVRDRQNALEELSALNITLQEQIKEQTQRIRSSEEQYRLLVEHVPDIILVHQDGKLLYVNPEATRMMGYSDEELIGTHLLIYVPAEYHGIIINAIRHRMEGKEVMPYEIEILSKEGERRRVVVRGTKIQYKGTPASLNVLTDITERKRIEDQLRTLNENLEQEVMARTRELQSSLKEKEVLLKEIHHRVKNNMQVISSLLFIQARSIEQPDVREMLLESQNRIRSIALVHEKLYQSRDLERIEYKDYLEKIARHIFESYQVTPHQIRLNVIADPVYLSIDKAVPLSLIVNELITNSIKHAFPKRGEGEIRIYLSLRNGRYHLIYEDNGPGLPDEIVLKGTHTLGMQLIQGLAGQLDGTCTYDKSDGSRFVIQFPA